MPRRALIAVAAFAVTALWCGTALAAHGVLSGAVSGLPGSAQAATVRAVDATNGRVVADVHLGASRKYRLSVAPGLYALVADAHGAGGASYGAIGHVKWVGAGAVRRIGLGASAAARSAQRPSTHLARAASLNSGAVATVNGIVLNAAPGSGLRSVSLDDAVLGQIFDPCATQGVRFVDTSKRVIDELQAEQDLRETGRSPSQPYRYNPLAPQYQISGTGSASADGQVTLVIDITDLKTGAVIAHHTASGTATRFYDVLLEVADQFAQEECGAPIRSHCPRLMGRVEACITSIIETGSGGTVSQSIKQGSCQDPEGFSRAAATGISWEYTFPHTERLSTLPGGVPGDWFINASYRVDAMCGLNNEHCSDEIHGARTTLGSLPGWMGTGSPGRWRITIPGLAAGYHPHCSASAIDDPAVRASAVIPVTLRGRPGRPVPRMMRIPFTLSQTLACGPGCQDSYALSGRVVINGWW